MPARKSWLLRVSEIRRELAEMQVPVVDRAVFERLFGVRRRRAVQLMGFFGDSRPAARSWSIVWT